MEANKNKSKLVIVTVVVLALVVGLLIWVFVGRSANAPSSDSSDTETSSSSSSQQDQTTDSTQSESKSTIVFTDDGFQPSSLTVSRGTTVTIKNESSDRLQFSSDDHPTHRLNSEMNLSTIDSGESTTYVANEVGEWGYHDHLNDSLTGTITVTE